ncbi:transporter substrate-binding domain-containing protein [Heliobacterium gestii]|uniref:Transporter substrate-binding domain-containing protein n=1 Tax=Heliomicrobium gestii TaxID=2699 RepID=A0A845LEN9_HELGE|nr:ABC transporter substrate-binding protein [Heliomicrobium gestii]MBM7868182.1 putative glutamine transport system substrate-binding protein [Heliomicrobium gestii]MZP43380.1 transporter substrate-binding domain-containing protein [Heliomicrobium gestii]
MFKKWTKGIALCCTAALLGALAVGCGGGAPAGGEKKPAETQTQASGDYIQTIKNRGYLIAGVKNDVPLFGQLKAGADKPEGFEVDIMKELAKKLFGDESKVKLEKVESATRIPMLQNGQIDIVAGTTTITEERKKQVDFSDVYFMAGQSLLVKKDSPIKSVTDLKGKSVSTVRGSTSAKNIREKAPDAKVDEYATYTEAFQALKLGRAEAMTTDNSILMGFATDEPDYVLVGGLFTEEPYGFGFQKGHPEWVKYVNDFMKEMKANGKYDELYKKWFKQDPPK